MAETSSPRLESPSARPKKGWLNLFALLGCVVASYALYIEFTHVSEADAKALNIAAPTYFCDSLFSIPGVKVGCSHALTGPYGRVLRLWGIAPPGSPLDVPNSALGLAYYLLALLPWHAHGALAADAFMLASAASLAFSVYLAYVLRFVLKELCVICVSSYIINMVIFVLAARMRMRLMDVNDHEENLAKAARRAEEAKKGN